MAFSTTAQQPVKPVSTTPSSELPDALLGMMILSVYGAHMSKKAVRKLKRKFFWTSLKLKAKSIFSKKDVSDRTLIYILLGVALVALLIIDPILVLALAAVVLVLILAGVI